jgi:hypothetical protein
VAQTRLTRLRTRASYPEPVERAVKTLRKE